MIRTLLTALFGGSRNIVTEVAGAFRPNAEASAQRAADAQSAALAQFAAEFAHPKQGVFDRFIDALNRLPRPIMAFGTIGFFVFAMYDPIAFGKRMAALDLVPDFLWAILLSIIGFYFGARELKKFRDRGPRLSADDVTGVIDRMQQIEAQRPEPEPAPAATKAAVSRAEPRTDAPDAAPDAATGNAAIDAWRTGQ
ncbi:holin family protein [Ruegeria sp.]|uniref:holin family protein n=1 Tax=Ruegeria sp. TaxID=1879320 RepID=UPI003B58BCFE